MTEPYFSPHDVRGRILLRLKKESMTTDQLAKDMRCSRSTVADALNQLKKSKLVCIVRYQKTGVSPIRFWGIGEVDAPKPPTMTPAEILAQKRERRERLRLEREAAAQSPARWKPHRDIAASWI